MKIGRYLQTCISSPAYLLGPDRTGPDRTGPDRTGPDSTGSPILAIAAQTPTPKHLHMYPGMQKGRPPVWEWRPLRRYWVTQLDPGGWN